MNKIIIGLVALTSISAHALDLKCKVKGPIYSNVDGSFSKDTRVINFKYLGNLNAELDQNLVVGQDKQMSLRAISTTTSIQAGDKTTIYGEYEKFLVSFVNTDLSSENVIRFQIDENREFSLQVEDSSGNSIHAYQGKCSEKLGKSAVEAMSAELDKKNSEIK